MGLPLHLTRDHFLSIIRTDHYPLHCKHRNMNLWGNSIHLRRSSSSSEESHISSSSSEDSSVSREYARDVLSNSDACAPDGDDGADDQDGNDDENISEKRSNSSSEVALALTVTSTRSDNLNDASCGK